MAVGASSVEDATGWPVAALLKPIAAINDPPAHGEDRDGGCESPPEGQQKVGKNSEHQDDHPEEPTLHREIVRYRIVIPSLWATFADQKNLDPSLRSG